MAKGELLDRIRRFRCLNCDLLFGAWETPTDCEKCGSRALVDFEAIPLRLLRDYGKGLVRLPDLLSRYGHDITSSEVIGDRRQ